MRKPNPKELFCLSRKISEPFVLIRKIDYCLQPHPIVAGVSTVPQSRFRMEAEKRSGFHAICKPLRNFQMSFRVDRIPQECIEKTLERLVFIGKGFQVSQDKPTLDAIGV